MAIHKKMNKKILAALALFFVCSAFIIMIVNLLRFAQPQPHSVEKLSVLKSGGSAVLRAEYFTRADAEPFVQKHSVKYIIPEDVKLILEQRKNVRQDLPNFFDDEDAETLAKKIADAMTAEELLAQCFMFGWAGQNPNERVGAWVESGLGNLKIFGWNTADSKKLSQAILQLQTRALHSHFSIPLFVATDQEGGRVRHVKGLTTETPSALACGASALPRDAFFSGYYIGCELAAIGINLNFAPTVDLYSNLNSTVIASRSFGDNPQSVARLSTAFSNGLIAAGVLSTAKHFPGHGDTGLDSHGRLPRIDISREVFYSRELEPFCAQIENNVPFIMSGHLNFPQFMKPNEPATFSYDMITRMLRDELGFSGLIVTDDMMMLSALNYAGNFSRAVTLALQAGNNIIESSSTPSLQDLVWRENISLMKLDVKFFNIVKSSAERIIKKKLQYFKSESHVEILPKPVELHNKFPIAGADNFFQSFAGRSVTLLHLNNQSDAKNTFQKISRDEKVLLVGDYPNLFLLAKNFFKNADTVWTDDVFSRAYNYDKIIFCVYDAHSAEVLQSLQVRFPKKHYIIISVLSPVFLKGLHAETALAVYSYSDFSFKAALACLCGDFVPQGILPLANGAFGDVVHKRN